MNQLNFKDEGLKVDWIGLNCEKLEESDLKKVAVFLSEFGFNVTLEEKKDQEWESRKIMTHPHNHHTVEMQQHYYEPEKKKFWAGTKINFTGENANHFYLQTHIQKKYYTFAIKVNPTLTDLLVFFFFEYNNSVILD